MSDFWKRVTVQGVIVGLVAGLLLGGMAASSAPPQPAGACGEPSASDTI